MRYVVDTNIFDHLVDTRLHISELPADAELVAMHVQLDEINRTKNEDRRYQLLQQFATVAPELDPAECGLYGAFRWGNSARWSDGQRVQGVLAALDAKKMKPSNREDALIAEVRNRKWIRPDYGRSDISSSRGVARCYGFSYCALAACSAGPTGGEIEGEGVFRVSDRVDRHPYCCRTRRDHLAIEPHS